MLTLCVLTLSGITLSGITLAACTGDDAPRVSVAAASSLTAAMDDLAAAWEADGARPTLDVSLAGSNQLTTQAIEGAPIDIVMAADERSGERLVDAGAAVDAPVAFARNEAVLVLGPGVPPDGSRVLATCAPEVPCGAAAQELLGVDDLSEAADTLEPNVRSVVTKLLLGEVDAGVVYRTDAQAEEGLQVVAVPATASTTYTATVTDPIARDFAAFLQSAEAQAILAEHGFMAASDPEPTP